VETGAIRFHLDEHLSPRIATSLRALGIDVTTAVEEGMLGWSDAQHIAWAREAARVIVTDDTDFLALAAQSTEHAGIVFCRRSRNSLGAIIRFLRLVHDVMEPAELVGRVEYL
jgi:predicted nuclease of predicted toxin-antitoxin system